MYKKEKKRSQFIYKDIAENISTKISQGILKPGDKLPPVRKLSNDLNVSITSILKSYVKLQDLGFIEAKPQSGYYVRKMSNKFLPEPEILTLEGAIKTYQYKGEQLVSNAHELAEVPGIVSLGGGVVSADMLPTKKFNRIFSSILRSSETAGTLYEFPPGYYKLRREIAKLSVAWEGNISPDDVIITNGASEAILLSLMALAKPGDTIITESPTFYLLLQIIKSLGMNILEVPTHPREGIDISSLNKIMQNHKIAASVVYPTISSPLGSVMPEENRKKMYDLLASKDIPLIECDVWGELYFEQKKPKPIKALDEKGLVLYLSSFTKTGAPGLRTGWVCPGRYYKRIKELKYMSSIASPTLPQMAIAEYVKSGGYRKSILDLRKTYSARLSFLSRCVSEYFPSGTKVSRPQGGAFLWIELPSGINSMKLQDLAIKKNITINPGPIFSTSDNFLNYMRLTCACHWSNNEIDHAIKTLGESCRDLM